MTDKSSATVLNRDSNKDDFLTLLKEERFAELKILARNNITWDAFVLNDNPNPKLMENKSFLASIIRTNNIELVDEFINLPLYRSHTNYVAGMSEHISYGFEKSAEGNNVKALEYYENLHIKLKMDDFGPHAGLRGGKLGFDKNQKGGNYITLESVFVPALRKAVRSDYPKSDIINFIITKKDKYGANDCNLKLSDFYMQLCGEDLNYDKAEYIRQQLQYNYDTKLFKDIYNSFKDGSNFEKVMNFLILEKNIPYEEEVKELIKDDLKTQKVFLYRTLNNHLEDKNTAGKPKL